MNYFDIDKQVDQIDEDKLQPDLEFRLNRFTKFFVTNIFDRALSYLVGWTGNAAKMLQCTSGGILKVTSSGTIYENNDTKTGTSTNTYTSVGSFDFTASKVEIWIYTNDILFKRSSDGTTFDDEIIIEKGGYYEFEASTADIEIKSRVSSVHSTFQVVIWQ